jgi:chromosome segregation ATPase
MADLTQDISYIASEQFALNFPIIMASVSNYMKTEYNEGRLKDTNYATVQAQAIQSAIQACLTLTMQTDSQKAEVELQNAQTEVQKAEAEVRRSQVELQNAQTEVQKAQVLLVAAQTDNQKSQTNLQNIQAEVQNAQVHLVEAQTDNQRSQIALQNAQVSLVGAQTDNQRSQIDLQSAQAHMIIAQTAEIAPNAAKQRAVQDSQISQVAAETEYTYSKKVTMEQARIDNLLIEDLKAQMQQLGTVGAGGLVPSTNDFIAGNALRQAIADRAGAQISFSAGTNYTKAS